MSKVELTLYDHILMWAMRRRAKHHGMDEPVVETQVVSMMGDSEGVKMVKGLDLVPPEILPQIIESMGFMPFREKHDPACPKQVDDENTCNCVQPPTTWTAPDRVQKVMGEDYATALAERQASA